jgi:hypothetical protein
LRHQAKLAAWWQAGGGAKYWHSASSDAQGAEAVAALEAVGFSAVYRPLSYTGTNSKKPHYPI